MHTKLRLLTLVCFVVFVISVVRSEESELVSVVVLYRHGDKSPSTSFPNDPYFDPLYWPMGLGQLTNNGKIRQYNLGQWLRNRYSSLLSDIYSPKEIYVLSSDLDRAMMSASANLAGLYPPRSAQIWNPNLLWQPIPVHTIPTSQDNIIKMSKKCSKYNKLYDEVYNSTFFQTVAKEYAAVYEFVSNHTEWNVDDVHYFAQLQSAFYIYSNHNGSYLPDWAHLLEPTVLDFLAGLHYARFTFTDGMKRLRDGPFFNKLFAQFDNVIAGVEGTQKMLMFSGHEGTLGDILHGMGVYDYIPARFAATVIWELWKKPEGQNPFFVELYYKKNGSDILTKLNVTGCSSNCSYDTFKYILKPFTIDDVTWTKECEQ